MGIDVYANEIYVPQQRRLQPLFDKAVACRDRLKDGSVEERDAHKEVNRIYNEMNSIGYLRENYHGGPYVTRYLVREAFEVDSRIPALKMRKRLPVALMLAIYRNHVVYEQGSKHRPHILAEDSNLAEVMTELVRHMTKSRLKDDAALISRITPTQVAHAQALLERGKVPACAEPFVRFVTQCEAYEAKTNKALTISVSW